VYTNCKPSLNHHLEMSYSIFAWRRFTRFFHALERTGLMKPISCDTRNALLQIPSQRPVLTWMFLILVTLLNGLLIPLLVLGKQALIHNKDTNERETPNFIQNLILIIHVFASFHQLPIFLNFMYTNSEVVYGFNYLIQMEKNIRSKSTEWNIC